MTRIGSLTPWRNRCQEYLIGNRSGDQRNEMSQADCLRSLWALRRTRTPPWDPLECLNYTKESIKSIRKGKKLLQEEGQKELFSLKILQQDGESTQSK